MVRSGNLVPTHGLGPIARCMDINRGDRFDHVASMSSNARGRRLYAAEHFPEGAPRRNEAFRLGDVNVSPIRTANGRTIYLAHYCDDPRPCSASTCCRELAASSRATRTVSTSKAGARTTSGRPLTVTGTSSSTPGGGEEVKGAKGGHGGMDFLEDRRGGRCRAEAGNRGGIRTAARPGGPDRRAGSPGPPTPPACRAGLRG